MAGVFGTDINSRQDFFRVLDLARQAGAKLLTRYPSHEVLLVVQQQLEAIARWTAGGRVPKPEEQEKLDLGSRLYREFDDTPDDELSAFRELAMPLGTYVKYWPDDHIAADPKNAHAIWGIA